MNLVSLPALLDLFEEESRSSIRKAATHTGVDGLLVYGPDADHRTVVAYGQACKHKTVDAALAFHGRGAVAHYCPAMPVPASVPAMAKSKTMKALDLVLIDGMTAYAAAKEVGINASAVSRALARREDKTICPCCGQVVREGFKVDRSVLKKN